MPLAASSQTRLRICPSALALLVLGAAVAGCGPRGGNSPGALAPTAGPAIQFVDVGAKAGINVRYPVEQKPMRNMEAFGAGCAFLDYDNDGWQDILLLTRPTVHLFRNKHDGTFEDVTARTGLDKLKAYWTGVGVGDYDGDGYLDLVLTGYRRLALLRNIGGARFTDVTVSAGLSPTNRNHWASSAAFMDLTNTGKLDLVLENYVIFGPNEKQYCELTPGVKSGCPPQTYRPEFGELWRNLGGGRFADATKSAGVGEPYTHGKGLVVAFVDLEGNGRMSFYAGNDGTQAELMVNYGGLKFKNEAVERGVAYGDPPGHTLAAMGADWADYDRDGLLDLAVSAFSDESFAVYRQSQRGSFENMAVQLGVAGPTLLPLGFGTKWMDFDNDGWPDLTYANGHVYDNAERINPLDSYRQPIMLFHNQPNGSGGRVFRDIASSQAEAVRRPLVGRGSAVGDFDNDGRMDLLVVDMDGGTPLLLHNESRTKNHWITLDLRGKVPNRFAYGAQVTVRSGAEKWVGQVSPASSYLSSSDPRVHFGLGGTGKIDAVEVRWSTGGTTTLNNPPVDQIVTIRQDTGASAGSRP